MPQPFIIVGTQRSGTTLLRLILNSHSKLAIPEEGTFLMPLLKEKYLNYVFQGKELDRVINYISKNPQFELWNKDFSSLFEEIKSKGRISLKELISNLYSFYAKLEGKLYWGDKTPSFFRKIDILRMLFPNAKFIHIVRDG
ncbi:MAG: sulfotransferase, partial [Nautiliaceae bacterium]